MVITKRDIAWLIILIIVILFFVVFRKNTTIVSDGVSKMRLDSIKIENARLQAQADFHIREKARFKRKNDSLEALPPKIKLQFIKESHEIDNKHAAGAAAEFKQLFSDNGIK